MTCNVDEQQIVCRVSIAGESVPCSLQWAQTKMQQTKDSLDQNISDWTITTERSMLNQTTLMPVKLILHLRSLC